MKYSITILAFAGLFIFSCGAPKEEPQEEALASYTIEQFMDVEAINGSSFSPDESRVMINSNESGIFNAYEIDLATGEKTQVTNSTEDAVFSQGYFPEDDRFIFTSDQGGNEITHIYIRSKEGDVQDIIQDSTAKAQFGGWNHDRTHFYYLSNARDPQFFDMYQVNVASEAEGNISNEKLVYRNENGLNPQSISRDGRYIALVEQITTSNQNMYLLDTESGERKLLTPHEGFIQYSPQYFSPDGSKLIYLTDEGDEFMYLKSYDIASGESEVMQKADWDIWYSYLSHNGTYRVTAINQDASTVVEIENTETGEMVDIPDLPEGDITSVNISDSEKMMTFYASSSKSPNNLYLYNFESGELKKLTDTMNPEINADDLVEGEVIRYKSFDGMEIPALLYKPKMASAENKVPALLWIHGGPGGQTRLNYSAAVQYLLNHGYAILAVNNRGSSGYGKTFYQADDQKHGQDDLQDCVESKKFLAGLDYIDSENIGILGGSYGGYMVMAALAFAPEEFEVGVNLFGVTNWLRTLKSIPPWWGSFKDALYQEMGNPYEDSVALYNKSPLFHADKIQRPFIVLQGANDPRVLKVESDEIVAAARENGVPVEYVLFDDEGHGFVKKENNITAWKEVLAFLDEYLKEEQVVVQ